MKLSTSTAGTISLGSITISLAISLHCMWEVEISNVSYHRMMKRNVY